MLATDVTNLLTMSLAEVTFAIRAADVIELVRAVAITPVPGCPDAVEGMVNVRGDLLPVYDLRRRFGLAPSAVQRDEHFVVVGAGDRGTAVVRVSRVHELRGVEPADLSAAASSTDPMVNGLARLPDGLLVICDLAAFLTDVEASRTAHAIAAAGKPA